MHEAVEPATMRLQEEREVLGRAARLLASATDFGDTLKQTLAACLPALGDFGFFDVQVAPGEVRRTVAAHQAPSVEAMLGSTRWARRIHPELNLCALSTGEPSLHARIDEQWLREAAVGEAQLRRMRELAFRSMISVPMRYRNELVGALTLFMGSSGRTHGEDDLALANDVALLAAPVVVNARLVAQHRHTEEALRQSSDQLRMALAASRAGIWDWNILTGQVTWSDRVYEMHGLAPGTDTGGFTGFRDRVHPEDLPRVEAAMRTALDGGEPYDVEFRTRLPDGQVRWIATRSELIRDAQGRPVRMVGASTDTTERMELLAAERKARAEAEAANRRLDCVARAGELLARRSLDPEDTLAAIASVVVPEIADWCRIDLIDEAGRMQRRLAHHTDPQRAQQAMAMAQALSGSDQTPGSMRWCARTGRAHYGRFDQPPASTDDALRRYGEAFGKRAFYTVPLTARGRTIGAMRVVQAESGRDIGEADRALVQELAHRAALALDNAQAYAEAEAARRQAESASRAKDEFLAILGHELRNPLAPISTALELMARRDAGLHVQERRIIARQVAHLSRLIGDLLDVSRITQGKVDLLRAPLDLRSVVAQALEQTQPLFEKRAHPPDLHLPASPVRVDGDATRLTQVLCNLLVNATKFTPPAGRVKLSLRIVGEEAELAVEDTGRGIPPELLPRVFDLFVQGSQPLDRQSGGLGLGLAIVRMIVEMHGGHVQAESAGEGHGSRFVVRLPVLPPEGVPEPEPAADREAEGASSGGRLMIVDDNTDAAETLADLLRMMGYEVRVAGDGAAAMRLLDAYVPQLALLDIGLPGEDGYALARRLRADARMANARLVALTGYGGENDRVQALAAKFDEHLVKPVALERLLPVLAALLA